MNRFTAVCVCATAAIAGSANADVLWDQSSLNWDQAGYQNSVSGSPPFGGTSYTVCDVTVPSTGWTISSVTMYFTDFNFDWAGNVHQGRLNVFSKSGSLPASSNDPGLGTLVSMSDTEGYDSSVGQSYNIVTASGLNVSLAPGSYWIGITPIISDLENGLNAATTIGDYSPTRSPFTGFGAPPANITPATVVLTLEHQAAA